MSEDRALNGLAALSSDGKIVAASRDGVVCWWETASGKKLHQLQTGQKGLLQLAFSADARSLLTLGTGGETSRRLGRSDRQVRPAQRRQGRRRRHVLTRPKRPRFSRMEVPRLLEAERRR